MRAAALAAKGAGPLPPQLWRWSICGQPTWSEFDATPYRELVSTLVMQRVYETVQAWVKGRPSAEVSQHYAELVRDGIVGKDIK